MPIPSQRFQRGDVFIDYDFERVMFRYDATTQSFFRKFYGEVDEKPVPSNNRLLADAIRGGDEIDEGMYAAGRPA